MTTRTYVVEDNEIMREMLVEFLRAQPDLEVVGAAASAEAALVDLAGRAVDVLMVDLRLPGMNGSELIRNVLERRPELHCVVLSGHRESGYVEAALASGARGYVLKGNPAELQEAVREVLAGRTYISSQLRDLGP